MPYETFVGWRYLYTRRKSVAVWLAFLISALICAAGIGVFFLISLKTVAVSFFGDGATNAGVVSLSSGVNMELADTGVTVSVINPPFADTALLKVPGFPRRLPWYGLGGGLKTPEWVAGKTVRALERGKTFYVLGIWPRFIHLVMIPLSPRWLVNFLSRLLLRGSRNAGTY